MVDIIGDDTSEALFDTVGDDSINGMGGDDHITVTYGIDFANGGEGEDTLKVQWGDAAEAVYLSSYFATGGYVGDSSAGSTRRVAFFSVEHVDITTGSGDDEFRGSIGRWDRFDGNAGVDTWVDSFEGVTTGISVDMKKVSSAAGQTLSDGTFLRNVEVAVINRMTEGNDTFRDFGSYDDYVIGGLGDDVLRTSGGRDSFWGADGNDTLVVDWRDTTADAYFEQYNSNVKQGWLKDGTGSEDASRYVKADIMETVKMYTGSGADELHGGDSVDKFFAGKGNDMLYGLAGNDKLVGEGGKDRLYGGDGDDTLNGGSGLDYLEGGAGADQIDGQRGVDTASYAASTAGVQVDLTSGTASGGDAAGDTLLRIENLTGTGFNDILTGDAVANKLLGGGGNDTLLGNDGDDLIRSGKGRDALYGGAGSDTLNGEKGNDKLRGGDQDDLLFGGHNADRLFGQSGDDFLDGGAGNDVLTGGRGDDFFIFNGGRDRITDFVNDREMIELAGTPLGIAGMTVEQVLDTATVIDGDTVIDFGSGNVLVVENFSDIDALADDMSIF